ncbi:hypothetical protein [Halobacterium hubeiense]|uniref:hypothetical protein n=1 Tax=Halobacterium hubeiense TaxID=1407499 RepID=UPI003C7819EA
MRHEACVICGGWAVFLAAFGLTALLAPATSVFVPALVGAAAAFLATPVLHTRLRTRHAAASG